MVQKRADERVDEDRIRGAHDTVARDGIAALLEGQIAADVVDDDQILLNEAVQVRDRLVQTHRVKSSLLGVRDQAFHIFQSAGDARLAVALQDGDIDQKVPVSDAAADVQSFAGTVRRKSLLLLCVDECDAVLPLEIVIAAVVERV